MMQPFPDRTGPESQTGPESLTGRAAAPHVPVLCAEVVAALQPVSGGIFLDGTFGAGGYSQALLDRGAGHILALDRDPSAILAGAAVASNAGGRLTLVETEFSRMDEAARGAGVSAFDGIVLDIGVSSMQLDQAIRGFSFRQDGPLDMRMSGAGESAADIVNGASETRLADIFYHYGEERLSRLIARAIVTDRKASPFTTTRQLADLIARIVRHKPGDIHPATRIFQALRIAVNDELGELVMALHKAEALLKPGGRLAIVSFHSLEDRIVKQFFAARSGKGGSSRHAPVMAAPVATFRIAGKWPVIAGEAEKAQNPRARSAKLRCALRLETPAQPLDPAIAALSALPEAHKHKTSPRGRRA